MFGYRRPRLHSKLSGDLCVGRYVTVAFKKTSDVIENLFLSLRSREHIYQQFPDLYYPLVLRELESTVIGDEAF